MHTLVPSVRSIVSSKAAVLRVVLIGLIGLLGLSTLPASAQVDFPGAPDGPGVNLRVYPFDFWSPRVRFGVGAGLVAHNLIRDGSQVLLTVAPARYEQVATLSLATANPQRARQYVLVAARALHTNRDWFYGLGPGSNADARESIQRSAMRARVRAGQAFLDQRMILQPHLGISTHRVDAVPASTSGLDARSQRHLQQLANSTVGRPGPRQTGLRVGVDVLYDTRPSPRSDQPPRGALIQGSWVRHLDVGSSFVHFDQVDLGAYGFLPLSGTHHLAGRVMATVTRARGDSPVPYYMRPRLGGAQVPGWARGRFVDSDRLIGSVLYRFPLFRVLDLARVDGHLGVHAASVYDDVFSDATFDVTLDSAVPAGVDRVPFRPAASIGLRTTVLHRDAPLTNLALGISPEGVTAVRFTFTQDLQALRPPHHRVSRAP